MARRDRVRHKEETAPAAPTGGCDIVGCDRPAKRHIPVGKVERALPDEKVQATGRSAALCREHYRDFKKATRSDRDLERAAW